MIFSVHSVLWRLLNAKSFMACHGEFRPSLLFKGLDTDGFLHMANQTVVFIEIFFVSSALVCGYGDVGKDCAFALRWFWCSCVRCRR